MITDINANITQQILYAPFGEVISEYNAYWHQGKIPDYQFNGKEFDEENSMYYYEARYYVPPTFILRDPLFEARPWMSMYAYCSNNPVNRIDPTGMFDDGYTVNSEGYFERVDNTGGEQYDVIYNKSDYQAGKREYDETGNKSGIKIDKGIIDSKKTVIHENTDPKIPDKQNDRYEIKSDMKAEKLLKFLAKNTHVEWGNTLLKNDKEQEINVLQTSHERTRITGSAYSISRYSLSKNGAYHTLIRDDHSHPDGPRPSSYDMDNKSLYNTGVFRILYKGNYYKY
jgi:RHS repeat-associated protein